MKIICPKCSAEIPQNGQPVYGVGIFLKNRWRPITFGSNLGEAERLWLVGEIHAFWKEMTGPAA
jgi:hypothetical protein